VTEPVKMPGRDQTDSAVARWMDVAPDTFAPGAYAISAYLVGCRPPSVAIGSFFLMTTLLLADMIFVSKAIWSTMVANAFDMNVSTSGSLLSKLSHQPNSTLSRQTEPQRLGRGVS
jgi:hypothetical protein